MPTRTAHVASSVGLHARPAGLFVGLAAEAAQSGLSVTIGRPGDAPVNAASILSVLGLGVRHGELVEIGVDGPPSPAVETVLDLLVAELSIDRDAEGS